VLTEARAALRSVERIHEHCASWSGLDRGSAQREAIFSAPFGDLPCIGVDLIELRPNQAVVVEVEPAGEGDLRAGWQKYLLRGTLFRSQKIATVDHGRGHRLVVDH
jgi:hypothetical protein